MTKHFSSAVLCDVGGTNITAALFDGERLSEPLHWRSSDFSSGSELAARLLAEYGKGRLAFAIAGPVASNSGKLTNGALEFSSTDILKIDGVTECLIVNDMVAAAISEVQSKNCLGGITLRHFDTLFLNAGTGFGGALMSSAGHGVLGIEPGRLSSSFFSEIIREFGLHDRDYFEYEKVIGGNGIVRAFMTLAENEGYAGKQLEASQIFQISKNGFELAERTVSLFRKSLATACAELCLLFPDVREVVMSGSLVRKNEDQVLQQSFSETLINRLELADHYEVPLVRVISHQNPELIGLAKLLK